MKPSLDGLPAAAAAAAADVHKSRDTLLAEAVAQHNLNHAKALLDRGANPNTVLSEHKATGTVLHAAADGHMDLVTCLLDHGTEPIRHNREFKTPRDLAVENNHAVIADLLRRAEQGTYKPAKRSAVKKKSASTADAQAKALKKFNDDNYVKQNFGLGGMTYRSNKWQGVRP